MSREERVRLRGKRHERNRGGAEGRWRAVSRCKLLTDFWNRMRKW